MYRKKRVKKKKIKDSSSSNLLEIKKTYENLKKKYGVSGKELSTFYKAQLILDRLKLTPDLILKLEEKEISIPVSIFNEELSTFESIVKYLKENLGLANREIAILTSKSQKSIWQVYNSAKKKFPSVSKVTVSDYYIPVSALQKPFTILESVVKFLKEDLRLSFHKIAIMLKRDDRTIWTVYNRAKKKNE